MNLMYRHNKRTDFFIEPIGKDAGTVAFEKPHSLEILQEMRKQFTKSCGLAIPKITVNIGGAFLRKGDAFNKKLGRQLAESRIHPVQMEISMNTSSNLADALHLTLTGVDPVLEVQYTMLVKIYRDSAELRVMGIYTRSWR